MDRRQRKTRQAVFAAFMELLCEKKYSHITVGEILSRADISRATFYSHFETKDYLLKELCEDLFCHVFDASNGREEHSHLFRCDPPRSPFLHLFLHLMRNDNHILDLLSSQNNDLFLQYFKKSLGTLVEQNLSLFQVGKTVELPESFRIHHISSVFVETLRWWLENGRQESPETLTEYFCMAV